MSTLTTDIDTAITAAVNARIEAELTRVLSGDEVLGAYVAAALRQPVEVRTDGYRTSKEPFLHHVLTKAIQEATKQATQALIAEELPTLKDEVRKALRRNVSGIADALVTNLGEIASKPYGVSVDLTLKMPSA